MDLTHAQKHYARTLWQYLTPGISWLDVGCGRQIVPRWGAPLPEQQRQIARVGKLVGVDVDNAIHEHPLLRDRVIGICGDRGDLPFAAESFDLVTANMVVEHVADPRAFLRDVHRVLRPGGRFLFHTPNLHDPRMWAVRAAPEALKMLIIRNTEGRAEADVFPAAYRMNTVRDIRALAWDCNFRVEELRAVGSVGLLSASPIAWAERLLMRVIGNRSNLLAVFQK